VTDGGLKLAFARNGKPLTLKFTVPENPFIAATVTVYVALEPRVTVWLDGVTLIEKSGVGGALTTSVTVVLCVKLPLVPTMVRINVPAGVDALVVTVMVDEPDPAIDGGLNEALAPAGSPLALNVTAELNPFDAVTVALYVVPLPAVTV
jgi:hypothetical protein